MRMRVWTEKSADFVICRCIRDVTDNWTGFLFSLFVCAGWGLGICECAFDNSFGRGFLNFCLVVFLFVKVFRGI